MFINKFVLKAAAIILAAGIVPAVQPLVAQTSSESGRIEKLERAVEQLQKRNAELEQEVKSLQKQTESASQPAVEGKTKTQVTWDGKTYVEKNVAVE